MVLFVLLGGVLGMSVLLIQRRRHSGRLLLLFGAGMLMVVAQALVQSLGLFAVGLMAYSGVAVGVMGRPSVAADFGD
jgi:hypothetical protein